MNRPLCLLTALAFTGCASEPGWIDDRFFVRNGDADLYIHAVGDGTSNRFILFLHGGPGGGSATYELAPSAPTLHENAVMIYMDQRSSGASEGTTPTEDLSLELLTDDVLVVMDVIEELYLKDRAGDPQLWLMGHSWGGMLGPSVLFTTDAPERLAGWIEVNGAHDIPKLHADSREMLLTHADERLSGDLDEDAREAWKEIQDLANKAKVVPKNVDDMLELNEAAHNATELIDEVVFENPDGAHAMGWLLERQNSSLTNLASIGPVATVLLEENLERSWSDDYRELTLPTLLIGGAYDFVVPPTLNDDIQLRIASDRVENVLFEESAHTPMFSEPDAYAATVLEFIGSTP